MRSRVVLRDKVDVARSGANVEFMLPGKDAKVLPEFKNL
jgi:hypothetical protein